MAKKIEHYAAQRIGQRIAEKALEHEYEPLRQVAEAAAQSLHDAFFSKSISENLTSTLLSHGVIRKHYSCSVSVGEDAHTLESGSYDIKPFYTDELHLHSQEHIEVFIRDVLPAMECRKKMDALASSIADQIQTRSVKKVIKEWPEVAGFVRDVMGNDAISQEMTVPFENLLKQFLALPAPTTTETTTA